MKTYDLDHAATTSLAPSVYEKMKPFLESSYGNPSSMHELGIHNKKVINQTKKGIAELLHCYYDELIFTGSGTESINLALKGYALRHPDKKEILITPIEHKATLQATKFLQGQGFKVLYLKIDEEGYIDLSDLRHKLSLSTLMVSIIWANNEIGTIQHLEEIRRITSYHQVMLHVDAIQMIGHYPIHLKDLDVDMMSFSSHKFYGPKGIGLLYKKKDIEIEPLIHGGGQEFGFRSGTEAIHQIIGFYEALKYVHKDLHKKQKKLNDQTKKLFMMIKKDHDVILNGPSLNDQRLPGLLSLSFKHKKGYELQYALSKQGLYVSTGSACSNQDIEPSHVIKALEIPKIYADGTIRLSLGYDLKEEDLKEISRRFNMILSD